VTAKKEETYHKEIDVNSLQLRIGEFLHRLMVNLPVYIQLVFIARNE
jgi:hypothetical protein